MTQIQVPDHVAKSIEADLKAKEQDKTETPEQEVEENTAYVAGAARVLDPTLLEKSFLDRMPQPTGWRMLILPYAGKACLLNSMHRSSSLYLSVFQGPFIPVAHMCL